MQDDTYIISIKPKDHQNRARDTVLTLIETEVDRARTRTSRRLLIELDELGCISEMSYYDYVRADDSPNYVELE